MVSESLFSFTFFLCKFND